MDMEPELSRAAQPRCRESNSDAECSEASFDSQGGNMITDPVRHLEWAQTLRIPMDTDSNPLNQRQQQNLQDMIEDPEAYKNKVMAKIQE